MIIFPSFGLASSWPLTLNRLWDLVGEGSLIVGELALGNQDPFLPFLPYLPCLHIDLLHIHPSHCLQTAWDLHILQILPFNLLSLLSVALT
jgi:hypothetical protein